MTKLKITDLIEPEFRRSIGTVAILLGDLRFKLISAGDALLATRLGDQGIARIFLTGQRVESVCPVLRQLAEVRGVSRDAIDALDHFIAEFTDDCGLAAKVAAGSWTYLGGVDEKHYGLFVGEVAVDGDLQPKWDHLMQADLDQLADRLLRAADGLDGFIWGCRIAGMEAMSKRKEGEQSAAGKPLGSSLSSNDSP